MPCEKCEKKWGKLITPDTWKTGSKSHHSKVKLNENKFLTKVKRAKKKFLLYFCDLYFNFVKYKLYAFRERIDSIRRKKRK